MTEPALWAGVETKICLSYQLTIHQPVFLCVTDRDDIKVTLSPRPSLPSVFSRSLCSPHQGPAVHRDVDKGETSRLPPGPELRCRECCPTFNQPACFTVLPLCCVTHRCKCNLTTNNNATCSCNLSHVYRPLTLTGTTFLVLVKL